MQLGTASDAAWANRPGFFASMDACCLLRDMHIVCIGSGVHRGAGFKLQRREALFG